MGLQLSLTSVRLTWAPSGRRPCTPARRGAALTRGEERERPGVHVRRPSAAAGGPGEHIRGPRGDQHRDPGPS